jgi:hypothetical protein
MPILLKCGHPVCYGCLDEAKKSQEGEKWITICCQECNEDEELDLDYHK